MARKHPLIAACVLALACLSHAQNPPTPKPGRVELKVINSITDQPVPNVSAELTGMNGARFSARAQSDEQGQVRFPSVPPGAFRITVTMAGYSYDRPPTNAPPILVAPDATVQLPTIHLIPHGSISGRALDEDGKPIADASVDALVYGYRRPERFLANMGQAKTDVQGRYKIAGLPPQRYMVRLAVTRDLVQYKSYFLDAATAAQALRVAVFAGTETPAVDFRVRAVETFHVYGTISGIRVDDPIGQISISTCADGPGETDETRGSAMLHREPTKTEATFEVERLPPGRYCLYYEELAGSVPNPRRTAVAREVLTVTDQHVEGIRMTAIPPPGLTGIVKAVEGTSPKMLPRVFVDATTVLRPSIGLVDGDTGRFQLADLLPGLEYKLTLSVASGGYVKAIRLSGQALTGAKFRYSIGAGPLEIELAPARGVVKGRVNFGSRQPEPIFVTFAPTGDLSGRADLIRTVLTTDRGEFEVSGLVPGSYAVLAWEKYDEALAWVPEFLQLFQGTSVKVANDATANVEVRIIPARQVDDAKSLF